MAKLILIEGTDCSGKETQTKKVIERLNDEDIKSIYFGFPNYNSPTGKIVGGPYLGKPAISECVFPEGAANVPPKVASLYYAADREYNIGKVKEYLNEGFNVFLDRYVVSNMAHQGGKIEDEVERKKMYKWLEDLEYGLLELPRPDFTIFLHMPYKYSLILKSGREEALDEHERSETHLINAEKAYLELSELYGFDVIECVKDGNIRSIDDINDELVLKLKGRFNSSFLIITIYESGSKYHY